MRFEDIKEIHEAGLRILEDTGVVFQDEELPKDNGDEEIDDLFVELIDD